jgi:membrane protease YdiL (CAAX protease family)
VTEPRDATTAPSAGWAPVVLLAIALLIRLAVIQVWRVPQIAYVPVELALLVGALFCERDRLSDFFLRRNRLAKDVALGLALAVVNCLIEIALYARKTGAVPAYRFDTMALVPVGVLVAGWRAGVYEELMFRSLTMGYLRRWTRRADVAVVGQAVLFWLAHVRYLNPEHGWGFSSLVFGLMLGVLTIGCRSVVPAMIVHAVANSYGAATLPPIEYLQKALRSWL